MLIEQFNAYKPIREKPELHVNGELTLGENIADERRQACADVAASYRRAFEFTGFCRCF